MLDTKIFHEAQPKHISNKIVYSYSLGKRMPCQNSLVIGSRVPPRLVFQECRDDTLKLWLYLWPVQELGRIDWMGAHTALAKQTLLSTAGTHLSNNSIPSFSM